MTSEGLGVAGILQITFAKKKKKPSKKPHPHPGILGVKGAAYLSQPAI